MTGLPERQLAIEELDALDESACHAALAPLFEGAPRFLARLCAARPFGDRSGLFATARAIARAMPQVEQIELLDAHPRLGAPRGSVSRLSFVEQGYDRETAVVTAELEQARVATELERLNAAYEARFGFRYCVFVAGRPRATLILGLEAALASEPDAELARGLDAVVAIAADRYGTVSVPGR